MLMTGSVEAHRASLHFQTNHTEMNRRVGEGLHARFSVEAYALTRRPQRHCGIFCCCAVFAALEANCRQRAIHAPRFARCNHML